MESKPLDKKKEEELEELLLGDLTHRRDEILAQLNLSDPDQALEVLMKEVSSDRSASYESEEEESDENPGSDFSKVFESTNSKLDLKAAALTQEEKDFFFQPIEGEEKRKVFPGGEEEVPVHDSRVESDVIDPNADLFEDVVISPVLRDSRRLLYINLCVLSTVLVLMAILGFQQSQMNRQFEQNQKILMAFMEKASALQNDRAQSSAIGLDKIMNMEDSKKVEYLLEKTESTLSTRDEKIFCYFLLAALELKEWDFEEAKIYIGKGLVLKNEKNP